MPLLGTGLNTAVPAPAFVALARRELRLPPMRVLPNEAVCVSGGLAWTAKLPAAPALALALALASLILIVYLVARGFA
ncbi:hypothetical protein [Streptomyces sp. L500]